MRLRASHLLLLIVVVVRWWPHEEAPMMEAIGHNRTGRSPHRRFETQLGGRCPMEVEMAAAGEGHKNDLSTAHVSCGKFAARAS